MPISVASARHGRIVYAKTVTQVAWTTPDGEEHYLPADRDACSAIPDDLAMRRKGHQRQYGPRHRQHFCHKTSRHVWCESGLEELSMLVADRDPGVLGYRAQGIEFVWPVDSARASHVVDRIDFLRGGRIRLTDVHRAGDAEFDEQADLTRAACENIGWQYDVFHGLPIAVADNITFLAADRHSWITHGREELLAAVLSHASSPIVISELCQRAWPEFPHVALPLVYHALWHNDLSMNLSEPIHPKRTVVWRTGHHTTKDQRCCAPRKSMNSATHSSSTMPCTR